MITLVLILCSTGLLPPDTLSLQDSYEQLERRYPLQNKAVLEREIADLKLQNLHTRYYPQLNVQVHGTYQSHVTEINFTPPNVPTPEFHKDQYRAEARVSQLLYAGGRIEAKKDQARRQSDIRRSKVEVSLHEVRKMVDRIYFNILQMEKNEASLQWAIKKIESRRKQVNAQVEHGNLLPSDLHVLEVERNKLQQKLIGLEHDRVASYRMLGKLLSIELDTATILNAPEVQASFERPGKFGKRPEYEVFHHQLQLLSARRNSVKSEWGPEIRAFATTGYGRPGLDRFDPEFRSYYIIGLKAQWSMWELLNNDRKMQQIRLEREQVKEDRRAFTRRLRSSVQQYYREIDKMERLMEKDRQIVEQRKKIVKEKEGQLENGAITTSDYLEELYEARRARLQLELHRLEQIYARVQLLTQMNESWN